MTYIVIGGLIGAWAGLVAFSLIAIVGVDNSILGAIIGGFVGAILAAQLDESRGR